MPSQHPHPSSSSSSSSSAPARLSFVREALFDDRVDPALEPLLRELAAFHDEVGRLRGSDTPATDDERARLRLQHDQLFEASRAHLAPHLPHLDHDAAAEAFVAAVQRLVHYPRTVLADTPPIDTFGSRTVWHFDTDLDADTPSATPRLLDALERAWPLPPDTRQRLADALVVELDALELRRALVAALRELVPLRPRPTPTDIVRLFERLYGPHPWAPGELELVVTATAIFFLAPLETPPEGTPGHERADFVAELTRFDQEQLANFPVFGTYDTRHTDPDLVAALARACNAPEATVRELLVTMVSVLPRDKTEQYILHDVWGHHWQAQLFAYEHTYREIAAFGLLPPLEQPFGTGGDHLAGLLEAAMREGPDAVDARWTRYLEAVHAERLAASLLALLAEVLADAVEFKFLVVHPEGRHTLQSSSFFKDQPTKLDLTLADLPWYFHLARRGFRRLARREDARAGLARAFAETHPGHAPDAVRAVVDALAERTATWLEHHLERRFELRTEPQDGTFRASLFARVAANFLGVQAVINGFFRAEMTAPTPTRPPLRRLYDLLVFASAAFLELDPARHFWHLDEFLAGFFPHGCARLVEALGALDE